MTIEEYEMKMNKNIEIFDKVKKMKKRKDYYRQNGFPIRKDGKLYEFAVLESKQMGFLKLAFVYPNNTFVYDKKYFNYLGKVFGNCFDDCFDKACDIYILKTRG